jgi:hypothetical protein
MPPRIYSGQGSAQTTVYSISPLHPFTPSPLHPLLPFFPSSLRAISPSFPSLFKIRCMCDKFQATNRIKGYSVFYSIIASFIIPALLTLTLQSDSGQKYPVAADHSFEPAVYIQKGLPAHDRKWSGDDYEQALAILRTIASQDATQLPRFGSPASGLMFARMVSLDNLSLYNNKTVALDLRLQERGAILTNLGLLIGLYASVSTAEKVFDAELIELTRLTLETCVDVPQMLDKAMASASPEIRQKSQLELAGGFAQIVNGCLTSLTEKQLYRTANLIRLAQTLERTLPAIIPFLPPGTQQEIPVRLKQIIEQESDPELKSNLIRISTAISKAKKG